MGGASVETALLQILCFGRPVYDVGYVGWGTPGLFSMLNSVADELLIHVYRGERPRDVRAYYAGTRLLGYGQVSLGEYFVPWSCDGVSPPSSDVDASTVPTLLQAPRYVVASRLLHVLFKPRADPTAMAASSRFAVAIHLRRGDKLREARNAERIQLWNDSQIVPAVTRYVPDRLTKDGSRPAVLLASDDNAFATEMDARLRAKLPFLQVVRPTNDHDAGTKSPFFSCTAACIPPLQRLAEDFGRADVLMLSTKSNMGSFMLTWWGAANGDAIPTFVDMDQKTVRGQLVRGRHFCALSWGSRRGMCESNRTNEWVGPPASTVSGGAGGAAADHPRRAHGLGTAVVQPGAKGRGPRSGGAMDGCASPLSGSDVVADVYTSLTRILCDSGGGYEKLPDPITRDGVVGLFSQLNAFADALLARVYKGQGPTYGLRALLAATRLVGYGGGTMADHFGPSFTCPADGSLPGSQSAAGRRLAETGGGGSGGVCGLSIAAAVDALIVAPRYTVVGALLRLALRPHAAAIAGSGGPAAPRFDLAVHIRRGDRLWVDRSVEKITEWTAETLLQKMTTLIQGEANPTVWVDRRWRVLLASDDNAYLSRLAALSRAAGLVVEVAANEAERFDDKNHSMEAAKVCDGSCISSLLGTVERFAHADRLILSTKSNLGGYILTWWGASNPTGRLDKGFIDLDGAMRREALPRKYFCELTWGSRHGLCLSGQTTCEVPQLAQRSFCRDKTSSSSAAGSSGALPDAKPRAHGKAGGKAAGKAKGGGSPGTRTRIRRAKS